MPKLWNFQSNLNRGELDPLAVGRIDLQSYYHGVRTGTNVLALPQGGMKKRPGMEFLGTGLGDGRLESFSFNVEQNYLLVFTALKMQIYKDGVLQTNINGSGNDYATTPWSLAQLADIDFIQSADTAIVVHPDVVPTSITRTSDTAWAVATITLTNTPQFDFDDGSSPTPVSEVQRITFTAQVEGDKYRLGLEGILTDDILFAGDNATNEENIRIALQALPTTSSSGISVAAFAANIFDITFANASAKPWDLLTGTPVVVSSGTFKVATTRSAVGTSRAEDVWSAGRGYPRTCTFHEGRLYFGGSKSRLNTLWGSRVNDFFNFDGGRALDDEGIDITLDTDQVNAIEGVFSNRALQIFTSGGEFVVQESPVTPSGVSVKPQSNLGSKRVRPVTIDGVTLFVQRTGKALIQFVYINEFQPNQSNSVSVLSPHLIINPVQMQVSRGTESSDANYVYLVNTDGTMTVFNTLISEDVTAFTRWSTRGDIKSVAVVDNEINFLVEREINSSTVYYIEKENDLLNTDAGTRETGLSSDTLTGLSHLEAETVKVKADGAVQLDELVASGQITIDHSVDTIEAGIEYLPEIKLMPLNVPLQDGPSAASKKRILKAAIRVHESNGIIVNGQRIPDKEIGQNQFDAPIPQTGIKEMHLHGYSTEAQITITQDTPMPMTILSIGMEVNI